MGDIELIGGIMSEVCGGVVWWRCVVEVFGVGVRWRCVVEVCVHSNYYSALCHRYCNIIFQYKYYNYKHIKL